MHHLCPGGNKILDEFLLRVFARFYLDEFQAQFRADLWVFVQLVMVTFKVSSAQHTGVLIGSPLKIAKSMPPNEAQNMRSMVWASRKSASPEAKRNGKENEVERRIEFSFDPIAHLSDAYGNYDK